jgi:DNA (cytosine-5)-methyltransferase 1
MRYLSVCSGIEAASAAWHSLGWRPVGFSEIEPFPCSVLEHRFPDVTNFGDMTKFQEWDIEPGSVDVLVGGTPCQSFSIAGLRGGLKDGRGNLALTYCRIVQKLQPKWFVWENVPGVLSSNSGRDFGSIVGAMAELGYCLAYRVLDAQYFGVPQRRRRVFVVGCAGDWRRAAAVLFEPGCVSGDSQAGRKKKQDVAGDTEDCVGAGGNLDGGPHVVNTWGGTKRKDRPDGGFYARIESTTKTLDAAGGLNPACNNGGTIVVTSTGNTAHCLNAGGMGRQDYETETMVVAIQERAVSTNTENGPQGAGFRDDGKAYTLEARNKVQAVAFTQNQRNEVRELDVIGALQAQPGMKQQAYLSQSIGVRRLTPRECERLQGFPDDWTLVNHRGKPAADGPRYKAIGNSMAVPVMRWIGKRIELSVG